ncbi:PP2C family protein-serine/threonine phosphatase [Epibacterium sp. Ofav1-8]|jgi:serine/threonine protein phosphatase PrpC|uniref:PP2C family protein-serine/threonine phosphatase n=1 Tax=Epibacterium sp. Ofav1-8 TaxID=2917735 RepID=UPI001EF489A9|nr:protein phosphatase 2C domain-containing protein [Epibacterium sp. Ofav1-8]MCG7625366.1 protein phosphatase 2C domain-containing protein [Epibacterium sp. Ofav1-8]
MTEMRNTRFVGQTHTGLVRKTNEDAILSLSEHEIWLVSDGMGGHDAGDYASRLIADMVATIPPDLGPAEKMHALRDAIQGAHRAIQAESDTRGGATIGATVAVLTVSQGYFLCLWAGDSRIYRLRNRQIELLTTDHSAVAEYVLAGKMNWDEADQHPQANAITRAVGIPGELVLDKVRGETAPGDRFLLCSDGLTKYATFSMLEDILSSTPLDNLSDKLIQLALAGGGADNVSVIVVDVL